MLFEYPAMRKISKFQMRRDKIGGGVKMYILCACENSADDGNITRNLFVWPGVIH